MFRVSYINSNNEIAHKCGFKDFAEAVNWATETKGITPLKLLVYDANIECCRPIIDFRKF